MQCAIDFDTMHKFLNRVRKFVDSKFEGEERQTFFIEKLMEFLDITENVIERNNGENLEYLQVAIRGFSMLLLASEMEIFSFYGVFERIIELSQRCHQYFRTKSPKEFADFPRDLIVNCMPKNELSQVVQRFQLYITIVIMEKIFK